MRRSSCLVPSWAACLARLTAAVDVVYVTDLQIYTLLAPCARSAVSYNVATETLMTRCGEGQKELQSCICSNTNEFRQVSRSLASAVSSSCGVSATDDVWSASKVMEKYCDQAATVTFSTPTANIVNAYITDLPQMTYLPGCAQSAVSYAVMAAMSSYCPEDASLFAPCVCKPAKAGSVSTTLSKSIRDNCSNGEDVTAANVFFNEYCAMNNGTTSFVPPAHPPGDMTYHITALPQFTSLRACAQSGVSYAVLAQTGSLCGSGPQVLASCACLKSGMSAKVSSTLTSNVKFYCESTATADVTSALAVLSYYCSAAENKVVATAAESIPESYPTAESRTGAGSLKPTQTSGGGGGGGGGSDSNNSKDTNVDGSDGGSGGGNKTAIIAASVLGGVVAIALVAAIAFFWRYKRRQRARGEQIPTVAGPGEGYNGTPELDGKSEWAGGMASPGVTPSVPELSTPSHSPRPELQGGAGVYASELSPHQSPRPELQGGPYQQQPQELVSPGYAYHPQAHSSGRPAYDAHAVSPPSAHSGYSPGWQSGPVESYELDSNFRRNG